MPGYCTNLLKSTPGQLLESTGKFGQVGQVGQCKTVRQQCGVVQDINTYRMLDWLIRKEKLEVKRQLRLRFHTRKGKC